MDLMKSGCLQTIALYPPQASQYFCDKPSLMSPCGWLADQRLKQCMCTLAGWCPKQQQAAFGQGNRTLLFPCPVNPHTVLFHLKLGEMSLFKNCRLLSSFRVIKGKWPTVKQCDGANLSPCYCVFITNIVVVVLFLVFFLLVVVVVGWLIFVCLF